MNFRLLSSLALSALACASAGDSSVAKVRWRELNPLTGIGQSALGSFRGVNGLVQLGAVASVPMIVLSGSDTKIHNHHVRDPWLDPYSIPAVWGGFLAPVVVEAGLLAYGTAADAPEPYRVGCIVAQSQLLGFGWQSLLKLGTGREHPSDQEYPDDKKSRQFRFGFNRGGIDWGWPSGLMVMNTSTLVALSTAYPDKPWIKVGSGLWIGYSLLSIPSHEKGQLAWFSDALSGALMGVAIGRSVGKTFFDGQAAPSALDRVSLRPVVGDAQGAVAEVSF